MFNNINENVKKEGLECVEGKLGRTTQWMHEVRQIEEDSGNIIREETMNLVRRRICQSCAELEDIQDILMESVRERLSVRQLGLLEDQEMKTDPSVQFFGIEWEKVFARCFSLGLNIRIFKQRLSAEIVDIIGLSSILLELSGVGAELGDHLVSLMSDRRPGSQAVVSESHDDGQSDRVGKVKYRKNKTENLTTKIMSSQLPDRGGHNNFRKNPKDNLTTNITGTQIPVRELNMSGKVKYRKNKTENLTTKIARSQEEENRNRRKSTVLEPSLVKKKTSFVQKVSNIFIDYI